MSIKQFFKTGIPAFTILLLLCVLPGVTKAQGPPDPDDDPDTPVDGGVSLLIAAGVGYGIKRYRQERKRSDTVKL